MSDRAFVFVHPPGSVAPRLAGQVIVMETGNGGWCRFKYAADYLEWPAAFPLDPTLLALGDGPFESEPDFEVFNVLRDAGPDYWGRKVIERRLDRYGLTELEFLMAAGTHPTGALVFSTSRSAPTPEATVPAARLPDLIEAAERLETDKPISAELLDLLGRGSGTLGGMRPKATVEDDGRLWMAKLGAQGDRLDYVRIEYATLELARQAGLTVPEHRLATIGDRPVLLTARFDRARTPDGYRRAHYLSGLTMAGLHERDVGRGSYADLADWLRRYSESPMEGLVELFRRMVFNILIGNDDDHLRNHAVLRWTEGYDLSPAFDLLPQPGHATERRQAIGVGDEGRAATTRNARSQVARFGIRAEEASSIIADVVAAVAGWRDVYRDAGVAVGDLKALETAIRPGR